MRKSIDPQLQLLNEVAGLRKDKRTAALLKKIEELHQLLEESPKNITSDTKILELRTTIAQLKSANIALVKTLAEVEKRADHINEVDEEPTRRKWEAMQKKKGSKSTALIGLMDWHTEERVDGNTIDNLNHFDLKVAEQRVQKTFEKSIYLLEYARHVSDIDQLVVAVLGDMITGYIHDELKESNYLSPTEACLFVQDMLCTGIDYLLKYANVKHILVPCCHGNHGRTTPQRMVSTSYKNSYEWQLYHQISRHYRNEPRVSFKIENGIHNWIDMQGYSVRLHHGDNIRFQGGVGGITIPTNKKIAQWNKARVADLDIFGHYHQFLHHWKWICGGSLIGYNAYAQSIGADFQPPTQLFVLMNKDHGKVMAEPIFCEDEKNAKH